MIAGRGPITIKPSTVMGGALPRWGSEPRLWLDERFLDRFGPARPADPAAALLRWRCARLADLLERAAAASPWYKPQASHLISSAARLRRLAAESGLKAEAAQSILAEAPFTTPEDLAADSDAFLAAGLDEVEGVVSIPTSGTSGPVKRICSTGRDLEETVAFFEYGIRFLVQPGRDRVALAMSAARPGNVGDLLGRALARWDIPFLAHGFVPEEPSAENQWLKDLVAWAPTCLVGVPPQMLAISRHRLGPHLSRTLTTILLSGDVAEDRLVAELERALSPVKVFRHYGLTETGLGGAVECGRRLGPHQRDDLWVEIIDPDGGGPLPPGRAGEITVTPLTRLGQPLIRYRTGDEGLIPAEPCPCGSILPRLMVFGRLADRLALLGGRVIRAGDFEVPLLTLPFVRNYELRLFSGRPPRLLVTLITTDHPPASAAGLAAEALDRWLGPEATALSLAVDCRPHDADADPAAIRASGGKRRIIRPDEALRK